MKIEAELLELYRDPTLDTKPKLLEERGAPSTATPPRRSSPRSMRARATCRS